MSGATRSPQDDPAQDQDDRREPKPDHVPAAPHCRTIRTRPVQRAQDDRREPMPEREPAAPHRTTRPRTRDDKDFENMKLEEERKAHSREQLVIQMEKVTTRAVRKEMERGRVAAARGLENARAHCIGESSKSLTELLLAPDSTCATNLTPVPATTPSPVTSIDAVAIPPELMPKEPDDTWNKRQIGYIFALGTTAGLVFVLRPLLRVPYDRWMLLVIAMVWGLGSVGLPFGLHDTSRFEKDCSRHVGRLISTFFSVLVIYGFYLLALRVDGAAASSPFSSPLEASTDRDDHFWWSVGFFVIGISVLAGHLFSWIMGCCTGGDRDSDP